ncbi:putative gustatory receptor 92a [Drosophila kikkawai]|uniref:Gustatory receptor n=1 Tax=Drosophila kikkawai TaxID=30033 RepID=A0ABM3C4H7_DROKI|nr:putative gustatory receptor 92a [Drosophila kikkawai]
MFDFRKIGVSKICAGILHGFFIFAGYTGMVFFRFKKDQVVAINRSWWMEGISLILRFIPLGVHIYTYFMYIRRIEKFIEQMLHSLRLVLSIPCYLAMIYIQLFHGPKVVKLINQYLRIVREVRTLAVRKRIGFGGGREFFLIFLSLACQLQEIAFLLRLLRWVVNLNNMIKWTAYCVLVTSSNMILNISIIWYLSLGIIYKELNEYLHSEMGNQFEVLKDPRQRYQPLYKQLWLIVGKHILDLLLLTLSVQGAVDQFKAIRRLNLEVYPVSDLPEFHTMLEIFFTYLNLYKFRVRIWGLCDISNELFIIYISALITWMVFIAQYSMQMKNIEKET